MSDREALAIYGLRKLVVHYASRLYYLIEEGASADALGIAVANFEANLGEDVTFEGLVEEGRGTRCHDCDAEVMPCDKDGYPLAGTWEAYMVRSDVWEATRGEGHLCIGCLESRLGRKLRPDDFADLDINEPSPLDSTRLRDRRDSLTSGGTGRVAPPSGG